MTVFAAPEWAMFLGFLAVVFYIAFALAVAMGTVRDLTAWWINRRATKPAESERTESDFDGIDWEWRR